MESAASLALTLNILRVAQRIKKQSVDYTSAKVKLIQSWHYKTLTVIKRHKTTFLYLVYPKAEKVAELTVRKYTGC